MNRRTLWKIFTSLRLTVICLSIGILLVFFGTLAQVNEGLYQAQSHWFRSFFVWWGPQSAFKVPILPGGYTVGVVLLLNLFAAHIKRFVWGWRKLGIHLTHFGIILLLVGQLATDMMSTESDMRLREGQTSNFSEDHAKSELVFASAASAAGQDQVVSFGEPLVAKREDIRNENLPFFVRVKQYYVNSEVLSHQSVLSAAGKLSTALATVAGEYASPEGLTAQAERSQESEGRAQVWHEALKAVGEDGSGDLVAAAKRVATKPELAAKLCTELKDRFQKQMITIFTRQGGAMRYAAERLGKHEQVTEESLPSATTTGPGKEITILPLPEVKTMDDRNLPAAIIEVLNQGQSVGQWVVSPFLEPQDFTVNGKEYRAAFRFARYYHPFSITLLKTTHDLYPGTDIPKNYQSRVRVDNSETGEHREVDIYMNNPLRYAGLTFYQYQMGPADAQQQDSAYTSTLQVVRNPSWLTPYFGCGLVAVGMIYQFLFHLVSFVAKRRAPAPIAQKSKSRRAAAPLPAAVASGKS